MIKRMLSALAISTVMAATQPAHAVSPLSAIVGEWAVTGRFSCLFAVSGGFSTGLQPNTPNGDSFANWGSSRGTRTFSAPTNTDASGNGYGSVTRNVQIVGHTDAAPTKNGTFSDPSVSVETEANDTQSYEVTPGTGLLITVVNQQATFTAGTRTGETSTVNGFSLVGHISADGNGMVLTGADWADPATATIETIDYFNGATMVNSYQRICERSLTLVKIN
jgi:hypothetical protein